VMCDPGQRGDSTPAARTAAAGPEVRYGTVAGTHAARSAGKLAMRLPVSSSARAMNLGCASSPPCDAYDRRWCYG
jgi:hypothetical protein